MQGSGGDILHGWDQVFRRISDQRGGRRDRRGDARAEARRSAADRGRRREPGAVKARTIARSYLERDGLDIVCIPSFVEVVIDGKERTALRLVMELR
jgi:hypothetical protein